MTPVSDGHVEGVTMLSSLQPCIDLLELVFRRNHAHKEAHSVRLHHSHTTMPGSCPFRTIWIPARLRDDESVQAFEMLVRRGELTSWDIGMHRDNIASRFTTSGGTQDMLVSPYPNDKDYSKLLTAHLHRAIQLLKEEMQ